MTEHDDVEMFRQLRCTVYAINEWFYGERYLIHVKNGAIKYIRTF